MFFRIVNFACVTGWFRASSSCPHSECTSHAGCYVRMHMRNDVVSVIGSILISFFCLMFELYDQKHLISKV